MVKQEIKVFEEEEEEEELEEVEMGGGDGLFVKDNNRGDATTTTHSRRILGINTMRSTVMNSIRNNPRKTCIITGVFLILVIIVSAITLDLLVSASTVQEFQVTSVSLDVSHPLPMANVELVFKHGSRLSRVEPQGMTCTLDKANGAVINVSASKQKPDEEDDKQSTNNRYLLQATCPEQDVKAHAAMLWDLLTKKDTRSLGDFSCTATIKAYLGHVLPVTHTTATFSFSADDLAQAVQKLKKNKEREEEETVVAAVQETSGSSSASSAPSIVIRQARFNQMEIGVRIGNDHVPEIVYSMTPTLDVKLPAMNIVVQPSDGAAGMQLYMGALDATFVKRRRHQDDVDNDDNDDDAALKDHHQELVFGINATNIESSSSKSSSNLWFAPMLSLYTRSSSSTQGTSTTMQVSVDAGDSFLEIVIGHDHFFNVHFQQQDQADGAASLLESSRLRHRRDVEEEEDAAVVMTELEQEMQKRQQKVAADCMSVDNTDFEFSMCWMFQLSKGVAFVGNMTLYDYFVSAVTETTWDASLDDVLQNSRDNWVKVSTSALVEVGNDRDLMNITGGMAMNITDDVQFKMSMVNDGEIWPFEGILLADAAMDANTNVFTMTMSQASYKLNDKLLADATGSFILDMIQATSEMIINDPNMQFRSSSQSSVGVDGTPTTRSITTYTLFDEMIYNLVSESRFENTSFYMTTNETVSDTYFTNMYQIVDGNGLIARTASKWYGESMWDTVMEWRTAIEADGRQTFIASIIDPSMEFIVQGALLNNNVVLGNSTFNWYDNRVWDSNMEAQFQVDDMDSTVRFQMELVDDVLAYRLASALAGGPTDMDFSGFDYALEYLTFDLKEEPFVDWTARVLIDLNNAPLLPGNLTAWNITLDLDDSVFDYQLGLGTLVRLKEGQVKIMLEYLTFVQDEIQKANMNGEFKLQLVNQTAALMLQDTAELDFVADFNTSWFSNSSGVGGQFNKATLTVGSDLYMDIATGQVFIPGRTGSLLIASDPMAKLQLGTGINYNSFSLIEWNDMLVGWNGETFFDIHGHFILYLMSESKNSMEFFVEDSTSLDFTHNITGWFESQVAHNTSGSSSQSTLWVAPLLRVGSTTYFDSVASFQVKDEVDYGQPVDSFGNGVFSVTAGPPVESLGNGVFSVTSAPAAELQMGMVFSYDTSTTNPLFNELKLEWDNVHVGWQDNTFFDIHGHYTLDRSSQEFFVEDSNVLDFTHNISNRWFTESTSSGGVLWGGFLDQALLRVGPTVYLDSAGSMAWEMVESDAIGLLNLTSTPTAALQLGMGMRLNYFTAADQFRVLLDRVRLGWKDDMYFETPGTFKKALPSRLVRKEMHFDDVSIVLYGVGELTQSDQASFEKITADMVDDFFAQREGTLRRFLQDATSSGGKIYDVETTITVTGQDVGEKTVNGETLSVNTLSYDQTMIYMATDDADAAREYALMPFSNDEARSQYESKLIQDIGAFSNLQVPMETPVIKDTETGASRAADTDGGGGLSPGAIAGIAGAGVIVVIVLGLCAFLCLKQKKASSSGKQLNAAEDKDLEDGEKPEMALTGQGDE